MPKSTYAARHAHFRARLREARQRAEVTQDELARRLRRPQSFVSKFERGERRLDVVEYVEVMTALKLDPVVFLRDFLKVNGRA